MLTPEQIEQLPGAVIEALTIKAPKNVNPIGHNKVWTLAIYEALADVGKAFNLKIYPENSPYKGEYLVDFMLWDESYGPRLACECQWLHWRNPGTSGIEWAFNKLRGVKSDLKVLVFDADTEVESIFRSYLVETALHYPSEQYLFVQFDRSESKVFSWKPVRHGAHLPEEIVFTPS
jgi:hypothetical protein